MLDVVPRQVLIDVIIAEASLDLTSKLGVQFDTTGIGRILGTSATQNLASNFPVTAGGTTATNANIANALNPGFQIGATSGGETCSAQALQTDNKVRRLDAQGIHLQWRASGDKHHHERALPQRHHVYDGGHVYELRRSGG